MRFLNHDDAYAAAKKLFGDDPDLLFDVSPKDLPESFRVALTQGAGAAFATRFRAGAGVASVDLGTRCGGPPVVKLTPPLTEQVPGP